MGRLLVDFNGDGSLDIWAGATHSTHIQIRGKGEFKAIDFGEPIGALVRVSYSDGHCQIQRYGSSRNAGFLQTLRPLRYGLAMGVEIEALEVRGPVATDWELLAVPSMGGGQNRHEFPPGWK
jgi:hypothetical protein